MKRALLLLVLAGLVVLAGGGRWLCGPDSPLRSGGVASVEQWGPDILEASRLAGLRDPFLLAGLVYAESRGVAAALSSVGAQGLCQLMPSTGDELAMRYGVEGPPFAPEDNLRLGAHYLAEMLRRHHGDVDLALLSYRMGPGRVAREVKAAGSAAAFTEKLQSKKPSPWGYRNQVVEFGDRFRARAEAGNQAWRGWQAVVTAAASG